MMVTKPTPTPTTCNEWELAWEEYVDALGRYETTNPDRYRQGHVREATKARRAFVRSKARLRELDAEFCARLGI